MSVFIESSTPEDRRVQMVETHLRRLGWPDAVDGAEIEKITAPDPTLRTEVAELARELIQAHKDATGFALKRLRDKKRKQAGNNPVPPGGPPPQAMPLPIANPGDLQPFADLRWFVSSRPPTAEETSAALISASQACGRLVWLVSMLLIVLAAISIAHENFRPNYRELQSGPRPPISNTPIPDDVPKLPVP